MANDRNRGLESTCAALRAAVDAYGRDAPAAEQSAAWAVLRKIGQDHPKTAWQVGSDPDGRRNLLVIGPDGGNYFDVVDARGPGAAFGSGRISVASLERAAERLQGQGWAAEADAVRQVIAEVRNHG